ncbi:hypothetical protein NDU88_005300 [Pleurodeles waltl]|uniref:Uncharacterized protein n=1 Tax=Pleurodeles waltl TaxID=8319 RepID=A0AAV7SLH4_PLEWA|nr:hypothetical protein NDU88_005300 [Pleurodeles waltl]
MFPVTGRTGPASTIPLHVLSLPAVNRNPTKIPPIREKQAGHSGKAEAQEDRHRAFEEERRRSGRGRVGEDRRDQGAIRPNRGREDRRNQEAVRPNRGREDRRDQEAVCPNRGRDDLTPGSGMRQPTTLLEKRGIFRLGYSNIKYLGYVLGEGQVRPHVEKIDTITHVLSLPAVNRNPTKIPPIREKQAGHSGKAEAQEDRHRAFEEERRRSGRGRVGEDRRDQGAIRPNRGREDRRNQETVRPNQGREDRRDQEAVCPNRGREDLTPGSGMRQPTTLLEKRGIFRKSISKGGKDWEKKLPLVPYAIRTHVQASLGHSPFELLCGRQPRTLLEMLAEQWEETEEEEKDLLTYTRELRENLHTVWEEAHSTLRESQNKQKQWYDAKSVFRSLKIGDKALVLLPSCEHKLLAQ